MYIQFRLLIILFLCLLSIKGTKKYFNRDPDRTCPDELKYPILVAKMSLGILLFIGTVWPVYPVIRGGFSGFVMGLLLNVYVWKRGYEVERNEMRLLFWELIILGVLTELFASHALLYYLNYFAAS